MTIYAYIGFTIFGLLIGGLSSYLIDIRPFRKKKILNVKGFKWRLSFRVLAIIAIIFSDKFDLTTYNGDIKIGTTKFDSKEFD